MSKFFWGLLCAGAVACATSAERGVFENDPAQPGGPAFGDQGDGGPGNGTSAACLVSTNPAKVQPASLLFQLDVSGSMNCPASDPTSASCAASPSSRWSVFRTTFEATLATLPDHDSVGLMHYPTGLGTFSGNATGCVPQNPDVPIGPLSTTRAQVGAALAARAPAGGTPTHDAVNVALKQLAAAQGNRFLVLATDGNATFCTGCDISCNTEALGADSDVMVADVAAAAKSGVRTFVIGVPGSQNFRGVLSRIAEAGGTKVSAGCSSAGPTFCHYDMTSAPDFGAALQAALAAIGGEALSCTYDVPKDDGTFDPGRVNVRLSSGGQETDMRRDRSRADGWDYSDDGKQVVLYGAACESAKKAIGGAVTLLYGCPTVVR